MFMHSSPYVLPVRLIDKSAVEGKKDKASAGL